MRRLHGILKQRPESYENECVRRGCACSVAGFAVGISSSVGRQVRRNCRQERRDGGQTPREVRCNVVLATHTIMWVGSPHTGRNMFQYKERLSRYRIPLQKIRPIHDSLMFLMGIPILVRWQFYILFWVVIYGTFNISGLKMPIFTFEHSFNLLPTKCLLKMIYIISKRININTFGWHVLCVKIPMLWNLNNTTATTLILEAYFDVCLTRIQRLAW